MIVKKYILTYLSEDEKILFGKLFNDMDYLDISLGSENSFRLIISSVNDILYSSLIEINEERQIVLKIYKTYSKEEERLYFRLKRNRI